MISIVTLTGFKHVLKPTIFPDGTSQVWKLPDEVFASKELEITWNFEAEREIIDLLSLRELLPEHEYTWDLHIPFMPYARQDKDVSNTSTFNLKVLAGLINSLVCREVTSVDVHNPVHTRELIFSFRNIEVTELHKLLIKENNYCAVVFPDAGAQARYGHNLDVPTIVCDKTRDQLTGNITGHRILSILTSSTDPDNFQVNGRVLIIDDLCDGGATFISVARLLHEVLPSVTVDLYVSHGVFSKGRIHLLDNGINYLYTTNSLTKNGDGYEV